MADIPEPAKHALVRGLAQFMSTTDIRAMLREDFDIDVTLRQIHGYNPTKAAFDAGERWRDLFASYRKVYMEDVSSHDIASPAFRVGMLDRMAKRAEKSGNMKLAAELTEQAAKEIGGLFTNERRFSGSVDHRVRPATVEDARAELAQRLERLRGQAADTGQDVASSSDPAGQGKHGVA